MLTWRTKEREKKEKGGADQQEIGRKGGGGWKKGEREINSSAATRECYSYHNFLLSAMLVYNYKDAPILSIAVRLASSPGHSQILSHSRGEKSGEGLGSKLRKTMSRTGNGGLGLFSQFSPRLQDKIWEWPGDEATIPTFLVASGRTVCIVC